MVNFYLNIDASGSSTALPSLSFIEYIDTITILDASSIKVELSQGLTLNNFDNPNNILSQLKSKITTNFDNTIRTSTLTEVDDRTEAGDNKIIIFSFGSSIFEYEFTSSSLPDYSEERIVEITFVLDETNVENNKKQLIIINLPFDKVTSTYYATDNLVAKDVSSKPSQRPSVNTITIKNRSVVEITYNWGNDSIENLLSNPHPFSNHVLTIHDSGGNPVQNAFLSSVSKNGNVFTYNFQPVFKNGFKINKISLGDISYKEEGWVTTTTESIEFLFTDIQSKQTNLLDNIVEEIAGVDPSPKTLAEVEVPTSYFTNIFKFKLQTAIPFIQSEISSDNTLDFNIPNDTLFKYDFNGNDDSSFNNIDDWKWYNTNNYSQQNGLVYDGYQPWVDDTNYIAKNIFKGDQDINSVYITADIFQNEDSLNTNIKNGYAHVIDVIEGIFDGTSSDHSGNNNTTGLTQDENDTILLDSYNAESGNIPAFLLKQILKDTNSFHRLNDSSNSKTNTTDWISIPLEPGDKLIIDFKLKIKYKDPFTHQIQDGNSNGSRNLDNNTDDDKYLVIKLI